MTAKPAGRSHGYHHGDLRRALLDEAAATIARSGIESLGFKQLAARLGVTHTAPYRHFADKQALLAGVAARGFELMQVRMQRAYDQQPVGREQFLATGFAVIAFALQHPGYYVAMFRGSAGNTLRALAEPPPGSAFHGFLGYIAAWQAAGVLRAGEALPLALAIWSTTHGLASLYSTGQLKVRRHELRALADRIHTALLDGVGA